MRASSVRNVIARRKISRMSEQETVANWFAFAYAIERQQALKESLKTVVNARLRVLRAEDKAALDEARSEAAVTALLAGVSKARTVTQVREVLATSLAASRRAARQASRRRAG